MNNFRIVPTVKLWFLSLLIFGLAACGSSTGGSSAGENTQQSSNTPSTTNTSNTTSTPITPPPNTSGSGNSGGSTPTPLGTPRLTSMKNFSFGHSLIYHELIRPRGGESYSKEETSVPHWMNLLSRAAGYDFTTDGQYGFLRDHANLPPRDQWQFGTVDSGWRSSFASSDFTTVLITAGNFMQWQPANRPYPDASNGESPLSATLEIIDFVRQQAPSATIYIYENWPDMGSFSNTNNGDFYPQFNPSASEVASYLSFTAGEFHDWWIDYHNEVLSARPSANVKLIPVGPIKSRLFTETNLQQIPFMDMYEDAAPHGRPTAYFIAALITFMATYGVQPPLDYQIPDSVHSVVRDNYQDTVNFIWNALQAYTDGNGNSRVW